MSHCLKGFIFALLLCFSAGNAFAANSPPAPAAGAGSMPPAMLASVQRIQQALENITSLKRPGQDGYAAIWDGNKYIQCGLAPKGGLRCEAAGSLMQSSMTRVLTADRVRQLEGLGWKLDPRFGNYVQVMPARFSSEQDAVAILTALTTVYGADGPTLQVETNWIASEPCPPRNGPSQNLAGLINDAPSMAPTAVHACAYFDPAAGTKAPQSAADLVRRYGPTVSAELQRLRVNQKRPVHAIFQFDLGYFQCEPDSDQGVLYCEAESAESWPALDALVTPERIARLHAAGYADPGRAPNYWKNYPFDQTRDADIAAEILTLLHDVYGYTGSTPLEIKTEKADPEDQEVAPE